MPRSGANNRTILRHRRSAYWSQDGRCFWCMVPVYFPHEKPAKVKPGRRVTAEHLIPRKHKRERQDIDAPWNIVAACWDCNHERGDMPADQWLLKIRPRIGEPHFATVLQILTKCGISVSIGHPAQAAPMPVTPDCPPLEEMAPAP